MHNTFSVFWQGKARLSEPSWPGLSRPSTCFSAENDRKGAARSKRFVPEALAPFAALPGLI
jgi:hypothetical protein